MSVPSNSRNGTWCNVYVARLPKENFGDEDLLKLMLPYGNIVSARIMRAKGSHQSKGYAFVLYENAGGALQAVEKLNGFRYDEAHTIECRLAHTEASDPTRMTTIGVPPGQDAFAKEYVRKSVSLGEQQAFMQTRMQHVHGMEQLVVPGYPQPSGSFMQPGGAAPRPQQPLQQVPMMAPPGLATTALSGPPPHGQQPNHIVLHQPAPLPAPHQSLPAQGQAVGHVQLLDPAMGSSQQHVQVIGNQIPMGHQAGILPNPAGGGGVPLQQGPPVAMMPAHPQPPLQQFQQQPPGLPSSQPVATSAQGAGAPHAPHSHSVPVSMMFPGMPQGPAPPPKGQ